MSRLLIFAVGVLVGVVGLICQEEWTRARHADPGDQRALAGLADYSDQTCQVEDCNNLVYIGRTLCSYHELWPVPAVEG